MKYELEKCKLLGMPFGIKMVRGAYVNEETRIAKEKNIENPVCDGIEKTTEMIEGNLDFILRNITPKSELLVGSHNRETIMKMKSLMELHKIPKDTK